jgi:hypothetical protein
VSRAALEVPLRREQVTAASELYQRYLPDWQRCNRILRALGEHFPSNTDLEHVLPKAITLNQLYATNVRAIIRVAGHVVEVLEQESGPPGLAVVEKISVLSKAGPGGRHCRGFASRYCHLFVAADRFPIMDDFAGDALDYHLTPRGRSHYRRRPFTYLTYAADVNRLRAALNPAPSYAEFDHYLWLRGQWLAFTEAEETGRDPDINGEVRGLLQLTDPAAADLLRQAFPTHP